MYLGAGSAITTSTVVACFNASVGNSPITSNHPTNGRRRPIVKRFLVASEFTLTYASLRSAPELLVVTLVTKYRVLKMTSKPTLNDYANCNREAQKDGTFAGVTAGLLGVTGVGSGYYFSRAFLSSRLAHLERQRLLAEQQSQGIEPTMA
ncbi:hypothetical protein AG1IA_02617 [Rhizoctonia solani AG-1 IA]|uniref:Uncharacterized protein n=1 Tax=Thanatephorus cucumeris (strain AG1-IA) TaxID=983506 RepID=L8WZ53_THACA|nr:hypothetical protein AG1IA_02617 [Rhizoctonia solani AG-1 IA]